MRGISHREIDTSPICSRFGFVVCVCIGSGYHDIVTGHLKSTNHFIQEKMRAIRNIYRQILQLYHVCVSPVATKRCVKNHKRRTPRIRRETSVRANLFTPPTLVLLPSRSLLSSDSTECECSERHERTDAFRAGGAFTHSPKSSSPRVQSVPSYALCGVRVLDLLSLTGPHTQKRFASQSSAARARAEGAKS